MKIVLIVGSTFAAIASAAEHNVALRSEGAVAVADSEYLDSPYTHGGELATFLIDGKWILPQDTPHSNRWHSALDRPHPHWVWVRFRGPAIISRIVIHRADVLVYPVDFVGEYSPDGGTSFQQVFEIRGNEMDDSVYSVERSFSRVLTDNFRLRILRSSHTPFPNSAQLSEMEVFGEFVGASVASPSANQSLDLPAPFLAPTERDVPLGLAIKVSEHDVEYRSPSLRVVVGRKRPEITALSWDSLAEHRVDVNLLKPDPGSGGGISVLPVFPDVLSATTGAHSGNQALGATPESRLGQAPPAAEAEIDGNVVRHVIELSADIRARWEIRVEPKSIDMALTWVARRAGVLRRPPALRLAFAVDKTPVAPLATPQPGIPAPLPCVLHAADYGSLLVRGDDGGGGMIEGESIRSANQWNVTILPATDRREDGLFTIRAGTSSCRVRMSVESIAPLPELTRADPRLAGLPRHWLNTFQYRPDIGILSNNIVSDNAVFCMFTFTDPAVFTPVLPGGVEAIQMARESLDRYFAGAKGYGVGSEVFMDTNPALLISAWNVIRVTGDLDLLGRWLPKLEALAAHTKRQDRNGNGLPESTRTGNRGDALDGSHRTGNWWDCVNFGHEDAYCCALTYRAFRCLADLERIAGRNEQADRYDLDADRIREAYLPTFLNPETGILAGWKSRDGELHDYWFVFVNGMAISYGLVPPETANPIIDRIQAKLRDLNYTRFDLGLPGNLIPVPEDDYVKDALGSPKKADGSDTFGVFENGGATACYAYFYIQALYQLGRREEAERILWPMMQTYANGTFQNGIPNGGEWRRWDGTPSGYEGFLADAYYTQMAVFTGHYGILFSPNGFQLGTWSPLNGKTVRLGLKYMGRMVEDIR